MTLPLTRVRGNLGAMRYLFGTGLFGAITAGIALIRGTRDAPVTWRAVLGWASWAITLAFAIGAVIDTRRAASGRLVDVDSPRYAKAVKAQEAAEKAAVRAADRASERAKDAERNSKSRRTG